MKFSVKFIVLFFLFFAFKSFTVIANVTLPKLISSGMVLQRNTEVKVWGWADANEGITVQFIDSVYETKADEIGEWAIILEDLKAGGPFQMTIKGNNSIEINNIAVGDIWVCSGQSNMEIPMSRVSWVYPDVIANCENPFIRQFYVPRKYDFKTRLSDFEWGEWKSASPENILNFSAIAYFFAKNLNEEFNIPIGVINTALGGSPIEAWISEEEIKIFPEYYNELQKFKSQDLIDSIQQADQKRSNAWYDLSVQIDMGYATTGKSWRSSDLDDTNWSTMTIPGYWADTELGAVNGVVWFRKKIDIPASLAGQKGKLILGRIVDADSVFVNGQFVGSVSYQYPPRRYIIPEGLLKEGENSVVIRVISNSGVGGFVLDKDYQIEFENEKVSLDGEWKIRLGAEMEPLASQTFIRWKPVGLFNAMIAPLLNFSVKGFLWYQGESNASKANEYTKLMESLVNNWRSEWKQAELPFIYAQLPNFMETQEQPSSSDWALLREAQLQALSISNSGMGVNIDLGEWNDIHPLNKKDVSDRLALAAKKVAYNQTNLVHSGPIYLSNEIDGNKMILTFSEIGGGLHVKGGSELSYFSIAGEDQKFVWAKAIIENNKLIVWCDDIQNPVSVRYAWADNPDGANLINAEGLPASPFRTDKW